MDKESVSGNKEPTQENEQIKKSEHHPSAFNEPLNKDYKHTTNPEEEAFNDQERKDPMREKD